MNAMIRKMMTAALLSLVLLGGAFEAAWSQTGPINAGGTSAGPKVEADRVHLIVTGYTKVNGADIGPDCLADLTAVQSMFSVAFQGSWRNRLEIHPLYGSAWTADKIRQYLKEVPLGSNDVVVFYHAGHGMIQDTAHAVDTHMLMVNSGSLRRGEVRQLLLARHCRGVILLTDCCSSAPQLGRSRSLGAAAEPRLNRQTIRNLFLGLNGLVDITAAEVGKEAANKSVHDFAGAHGAFTVAFLELASSARVYTSWGDFFPALREMTRTSSGGRHQAQAFAIREETSGTPQTQPGPGVAASPLPTTGPLPQAGTSQQRPNATGSQREKRLVWPTK